MRAYQCLVGLLIAPIGCGVARHPATDTADGVIPDSAVPARLTLALRAATIWLTRNVEADGHVVYAYSAVQHRVIEGDNEIRQLMATRLLGELALEDSSLLPLHDRNVAFALANYYREPVGGNAYIAFGGESKLGGIAMGIRALLASPRYPQHRLQAGKLAHTILVMQHPDGSFDPWFIKPLSDYNANYLLTFYSGEATLALVEFSEREGDPKILAAAESAEVYYIDRYVTHMATNYYPAYVPWHTMALARLYAITKDLRYASAAFALNDRLLAIEDTVAYVGRFYSSSHPEYGNPHASSDGIYTEGLAYAYELAKLRGDSVHLRRYRRALQLAVSNLLSLQMNKDDPLDGIDLPRMIGAVRVRADDFETRLDNTQHMMDAFRKVLQVW